MPELFRLALRTYLRPREAFRTVAAGAPSERSIWMLYLAAALLGAAMSLPLVAMMMEYLRPLLIAAIEKSPVDENDPFVRFILDEAYKDAAEPGNVLFSMGVQVVLFPIMGWIVTVCGGWFGGGASMREGRLVVAWTQFVHLAALGTLLILATIGAWSAVFLLSVLAGIWWVWIFTSCVAEAHGFANVFMTFLGMVVVGMGAVMIAGMISAMLVSGA